MVNDSKRHKVSIIMPTYNRANYIGETIDSVRNQSYANWELIIVDDGSDDDTEEIVMKLGDRRISFHKAGRIGINGKIKNIGLEKVTGELIAFIDSDDLWAPSKLEKQVAALREYPEAEFSLTGGFNFKNIEEPIDFFYRKQQGVLFGDILIPIFKSEISATTPSLVLRKKCLEVAGTFDESKPFSDIDFIIKLASHFKAVILYEPLLYRRLHAANDSGTNWVKGYHEGIALIRLYKHKLPGAVARRALFKLYINFGEDHFKKSERKEAIGKFFQAWKYSPFSIIPFKKTAKAILRSPSAAKVIYNDPVTSKIGARPWMGTTPPKKILAIRLQAMGDVAITLPYLNHLRYSLPPSTAVDFLTRKECEDIPKKILLFNRVVSIGGGRNFKKQLLHTLLLVPALIWRRYDVVIDLQNNSLSRLVRKALRPKAWSSFDRFSPRAAGERTALTIEAIGLGKSMIRSDFQFKEHFDPDLILKKNGWDGTSGLIILNPASAFSSRSWPLENYVRFAKLWLEKFPGFQFLVLGISTISSKAGYLKEQLGDRMINIIDQTTPSEAFAILQRATFVLSEDSGLMHMAWTSGIPTLALFGSTRSDWARPLGDHSSFLDSSDLPCGNCMLEICKYGDVHCLTRYGPELVFEKACDLLERAGFTQAQ